MTHRAFAALAVAGLLALALPALVAGHGALVGSDPADGATITTPYTLTATYAEEIDPEASTLSIENAAGEQVANGTVDPDDHTTMLAALPSLPDGEYTVHWTTVTQEDNGVERGSFTFTVAAASANDLLIALVLAGFAIAAVVLFIFLRGRR